MPKLLMLLISLSLLTACTPKVCTLADWGALGTKTAESERAPRIPAELSQQCQAQGTKPDLKAFTDAYNQTMAQRCSSETAFALGSMSNSIIGDGCEYCASKEAVHACWAARTKAGLIQANIYAAKEMEEAAGYIQRAAEACKSELARAHNSPAHFSPEALKEMANACGNMQTALMIYNRNYTQGKHDRVRISYEHCQTYYADRSPKNAKRCSESLAFIQQQAEDAKPKDNGKRMLNFSQ